MANLTPDALLAQAKCYLCLGISMAEAIQISLLVDIVNNGSTGGGAPIAFGAPVVKANAFGNYVNDTGHAAFIYVMFHSVPPAGNEPVVGIQINGQQYLTGVMADDSTTENNLFMYAPANAGDVYSIIQVEGGFTTVGDPGIPGAPGHLIIPFTN